MKNAAKNIQLIKRVFQKISQYKYNFIRNILP